MTAPFLLDAAEAAKLLGVSLRTLRNLTKRADFPSPRTLGPRSFRWVRSELEAFACQLPPAKASEPPALVAARAAKAAGRPVAPEPFSAEV
jgi:excisionase family DNA binding protein